MPPYCDEHQMYYRMAFVDGFPYQQCVCVKCESGRLSGFDSPQGTGTTEHPSVAVADKGLILTEEELQAYCKRTFLPQYYGVGEDDVSKILSSHLSLLSNNADLANVVVKQNSANLKLVYENDELMAENMKLIKERDKFKGIAQLFIDGDQIELVYEALKIGKPKEEVTHE